MRLEYILHPRKIALVLGLLALCLAAQSLITEYLTENVLDADAHYNLMLALDLFSVNAEDSIPTWYAALLLFGASALLAVIATAKHAHQDRFRRHWAGLALIFLYLSMDEGAAIHELFSDILETPLQPGGYLYFAWVIVAVPLVILFLLVYLRFLVHLPPRTRAQFMLAGMVYVGGALGVESISANRWYLDGGRTFEYLAIATLEELCEMLGVVILIYALLSYLVQMQSIIGLIPSFATAETSPAQAAPHPSEAAPISTQPLPPHWRKRPFVAAALALVIANAALVSWALTRTAEQTAAVNQAIIDQIAAFEVQVTPLEGHFGINNLPSRQVAAALLAEFDEVMIVTWASTEASIALAADVMPFDRSRLTQVLYDNDETQFVIFDTPAVRALVGDIQPAPSAQSPDA